MVFFVVRLLAALINIVIRDASSGLFRNGRTEYVNRFQIRGCWRIFFRPGRAAFGGDLLGLERRLEYLERRLE